MTRPATTDPGNTSARWTRTRAASGLRVSVATMDAAPLVRLRLGFAAGAQFDPVGREGLASLATPLLRVGSARLDDRALTAHVDALGTDLVAAADWELGALTIELLPRHLDRALALLVELTQPPDVLSSAFERARRTRLLQLQARPRQPVVLANDWLARAIYGHGTYGTSLLGSVHGLTAVTFDDLRAFYSQRVAWSRAFLAAVGPVHPDDLLARLDTLVVPEPSSAADGPLVPVPAITPLPRAQNEVMIVDVPAASRTELRLGHLGVAQSNPDLPELEIVNAMLGGGAYSRLYRVLREQHGLAYSVYSRMIGRRAAGPFLVATCVRHDVTGVATALILDELTALRDRPPAQDEITTATAALTLARLQARASRRTLTDHLGFLDTHDIPDDAAEAWHSPPPLDPARAMDLARRHLHPDRIVIVAVGPARVLRPQLEQFGAVIDVDPAALDVHQESPV